MDPEVDRDSVDWVVLNVDNTRPEAEITDPTGMTYTNDTITFSGRAKDANLRRIWLLLGDEDGKPIKEGGNKVICSELKDTDLTNPDWNDITCTDFDVTSYPDGTYSMVIEAWDMSWNYRKDHILFELDKIAPEPPILTGEPVQYVKWGNVTRSWLPSSSPDVDYYMYKNITNGWTSGPYNTTGQSEYFITHPTGNYDRIFEWQVLAVDYAGNETWSEDTYKIVVDGTKPTVEITNVDITDKKLSFTVSGTDNLSGARTVGTNIYNEDNTGPAVIGIGRLAHNITPGTLTVSYDATDIDVSGLESGIYTIRAAIRDYSGNIEFATYQIEVDNTPPIVDITSHEDGDILAGEVQILGNITEENLSHYNLSLNPDPDGLCNKEDTWNFSNRIWADAGDSNIVDYTFDTNDHDDGFYMIRLAARDLAGNRDPMSNNGDGDSVEVVCIEIDNTPPVVLFANQTVPEILTALPPFEIIEQSEELSDEPVCTIDEEITFPINAESTNNPFTVTCTYSDLAGNQNSSTYTVTVTETVGAVLGEDDENTNNNTGGQAQPLFAAQALGVGTGFELTNGEEEGEEEETTNEGEVLGDEIQTCEDPRTVSGYIYNDSNKDDEMGEKEKGIAGVSIKINTTYEGNQITIFKLETDENGYWETILCPGEYSIEIDQETLPNNLETPEVLSLTVEEEDEEVEFNISATDPRNFWQRYWYIILILVALLFTTSYLIITGSRKEQQQYTQ